MKLTKKNITNDQNIIIIDDLFSKDELTKIYITTASSNYKLWFVDNGTKESEYKFLQAHYKADDFIHSNLGSRLKKLTSNLTEKEYNLERAFAMCLRYGDNDYYHQDYFNKGTGLSLVLYTNTEWDSNWGEGVFFEISDSIYRAFSVKPGRILIFDGTLKHKAGVPSRHSPVAKISLNLRFSL